MREIKCPLCHEKAQASAWDGNYRARVYCGKVEFDMTRNGFKRVATSPKTERMQLHGLAKNKPKGKFFAIRDALESYEDFKSKPVEAAPDWLISWSKTIQPA